MNESLTCKQCFRVFTDPVTLNCGHSLCLPCANEQFCFEQIKAAPKILNSTTTQSEKAKGRIVCPECSQEQRFEDPGTELKKALPPNRAVQSLIHSSRNPSCCSCTKIATLECQGCSDEVYCQTCFDAIHALHVVLQKHVSQPIKKHEDPLQPFTTCSKHEELNKFYCNKCTAILCSMCALCDHSGHHLIPITEAAQSKTQLLAQHQAAMKLRIEQVEQGIQRLKKNQATIIENSKGSALSQIREHFERMKQYLKEQEELVTLEYHRLEQEALKDLVEQQSRMEGFRDNLTTMSRAPIQQHEAIIHAERKLTEYLEVLNKVNTSHTNLSLAVHAREEEMKEFCKRFVKVALEKLLVMRKNPEASVVAGNGSAGYKLAQNNDLKTAQFEWISGAAFDKKGSLYVVDQMNHKIRKLDLKTGTDEVFAGSVAGFLDGASTVAQFHKPVALVFDKEEKNMYITDSGNGCIRQINMQTMMVSTIKIPSDIIMKPYPVGICCDHNNNLFVSDHNNDLIYKIPMQDQGKPILLVKEGIANPQLIYLNPLNNHELFIPNGSAIHKLDLTTNALTLLCGGTTKGYLDHQDGKQALFNRPVGVHLVSGKLLISDVEDHRLRSLDLETGAVETLGGDGVSGTTEGRLSSTTRFDKPIALVEDIKSNCLYITTNTTIRRIE